MLRWLASLGFLLLAALQVVLVRVQFDVASKSLARAWSLPPLWPQALLVVVLIGLAAYHAPHMWGRRGLALLAVLVLVLSTLVGVAAVRVADWNESACAWAVGDMPESEQDALWAVIDEPVITRQAELSGHFDLTGEMWCEVTGLDDGVVTYRGSTWRLIPRLPSLIL